MTQNEKKIRELEKRIDNLSIYVDKQFYDYDLSISDLINKEKPFPKDVDEDKVFTPKFARFIIASLFIFSLIAFLISLILNCI